MGKGTFLRPSCRAAMLNQVPSNSLPESMIAAGKHDRGRKIDQGGREIEVGADLSRVSSESWVMMGGART